MVTKKKSTTKKKTTATSASNTSASCKPMCNSSQCGGCFYFLGFVGAAIYYIGAATTFWGGVLGVLKAAVWPVFLVLKLLAM